MSPVRVASRGLNKRALLLLYPLLFGPLRVLYTAAKNPTGVYQLPDLFALLGLLLAGTAALQLFLFILLRRRWPPEATALLLTAGIVWFWSYRRVLELFTHGPFALEAGSAHLLVLTIGGAATVAGACWAVRRPYLLDRLTVFFALTGVLLVAWSALGVVRDQIRSRHAVRAFRASPLARELAKPIVVPISPASVPGPPKRDIYLIVLDMYGSAEALRELYGFENGAFEDSLRFLGFKVPRVVRSNYSFTTLSLPSILNFCHLTFLNGSASTELPHYLVAHNRAAATLRMQGYRFVFFPSQYWAATRRNPQADTTFLGEKRWSINRALTSSPLRIRLRNTTPLAFTGLGGPSAYADYLHHTFQGLRQIPFTGRPTFVFAHVLSPHDPFVLDRTCRTKVRVTPTSSARTAYLEQVQCINRLLLGLARDLLGRSRVPPIILLIGDHGPNAPSVFDKALDLRSPRLVRGRFGALGAFFLPAGGERLFSDTLTLVNVLPKVFNHYFGANLPMQPDDLYNWVQGSDSLQLIDPRLLGTRGKGSVRSGQ